ncbi:hypothetical protein [Haloarchaeobius amylolyticus]|uniref:hypothetical protein n=1 Tax=Haloarchaeobius amylolyticus TaxID=1198296 RepID=UPI002270B21B|nr:hypothetical protein [Haloarchaeobius amylolyticus]
MPGRGRHGGTISGMVAAVVSLIAILPKVTVLPAIQILDNSITAVLVAIFTAEFTPLAGMGFLMLVVYIAVSGFFVEESGRYSNTRREALALVVGVAYVLFSVVFWREPVDTLISGYGLLTSMDRALLGAVSAPQIAWAAVFEMESLVRAALEPVSRVWTRPPGRPVRWPFYLFITFTTIVEISRTTDWLAETTRPVRVMVRLVAATIALVYGLIIAHNFFPGPDTLPWRSITIGSWFLFHTLVSGCVLVVLQRALEYESGPGPVTMLMISLLIGTLIAVLDGLYPLPEFLLLGGVIVGTLGRQERVRTRTLDVQSRAVDVIGKAMEQPTRLFEIAMVFQGFLLGGWLLWLFVSGFDGSLLGAGGSTLVATSLAVFLLLPIFQAAIYIMWFWVAEILRAATVDGVSATGPALPPDLLVFPTLVLGGYFTAGKLFDMHPVLGLLALAAIVLGIAGMVRVMRNRHQQAALPEPVDDHSVPIAFTILMGGLGVVGEISPSPYASEGSYLLLLVVTLVPLYLFPAVRRRGVGPLKGRPGSAIMLGGIGIVAGLYLGRTAVLELLNSGIIGVAAYVVALRLFISDVVTDIRSSV